MSGFEVVGLLLAIPPTVQFISDLAAAMNDQRGIPREIQDNLKQIEDWAAFLLLGARAL